MPARRISWTDHQLRKLKAAQDVLGGELRDFLPVTCRAIFYQLVGREFIPNTRSEYQMLLQMMKQARLDGLIPFSAITDTHRTFVNLSGWPDPRAFVESWRRQYLSGYRRDVLHGQPNRPEVWTEKDAIVPFLRPICEEFTVPLVIDRGVSSTAFYNDYAERVRAYRDGARPTILYCGDFDPTGCACDQYIVESLREDHALPVHFVRFALRREDIFRLKLPHSLKAIKPSDPRYKGHVERYGELAVEIDALPPRELQAMLRAALADVLDMDKIGAELEREAREVKRLERLARRTMKATEGLRL